MTLLEELSFMQWLKDQSYRDPRPIGNGLYAAINPLIFTHAIIIGKIGDRCGIDDRWCYESYEKALAALTAWDGIGEPQGWHRHPASGRRRPWGNQVEEYTAD